MISLFAILLSHTFFLSLSFVLFLSLSLSLPPTLQKTPHNFSSFFLLLPQLPTTVFSFPLIKFSENPLENAWTPKSAVPSCISQPKRKRNLAKWIKDVLTPLDLLEVGASDFFHILHGCIHDVLCLFHFSVSPSFFREGARTHALSLIRDTPVSFARSLSDIQWLVSLHLSISPSLYVCTCVHLYTHAFMYLYTRIYAHMHFHTNLKH